MVSVRKGKSFNLFKTLGSFGLMFKKGDFFTKTSFFIMGFGSFMRKQLFAGIALLFIQLTFIVFMSTSGSKFLTGLIKLGTLTQGKVWNEEMGIYIMSKGDNSMLFLLFGVATIFVVIAFIYVYFANIKLAYTNQQLIQEGKRPMRFKETVNILLDEKFHITVLSLPVLLTFMFTIVPLVFMILIAFTNFDANHQPPGNLFTWVGFSNFTSVLWDNPLKSHTFSSLLVWTLIWATFATVLNYIFGMILALMINKKGIRLKKFWRTIFVVTIAVPQFVSLLLMSRLLADQGPVNLILQSMGWVKTFVPFLSDGNVARVTVIVVNLWVGIPYTMLITSGILMNIPVDIYESAKIDGAGPIRQFTAITLPYMLFVTTPYLITQFIGNINNFNVIYLLTGGGPLSLNLYQAGKTDLLVTWLYKLTVNYQDYALASTIGIFIFILSAFFSLVVFNRSSSVKKEEEFQ